MPATEGLGPGAPLAEILLEERVSPSSGTAQAAGDSREGYTTF